jgi:predicted metal-dependent hydrolase
VTTRLNLAGLTIDVERRPIKHLHLGVYPPDGHVRIAAPEGVSDEAIRLFAIGKLAWIKRQRQKFATQLREPVREYLERESHYVWGRRYLLSVLEGDAPPSIELRHRKLRLKVRPGTSLERRGEILDEWYRSMLRAAVEPLLAKWEPVLGVRVRNVFVQRMKTKWGSCNSSARNIRLNTELAKKPAEFLEYIVVHEMAHIRCPTHGHRFVALMDQVMPNWRDKREALNQLPLGAASPRGE